MHLYIRRRPLRGLTENRVCCQPWAQWQFYCEQVSALPSTVSLEGVKSCLCLWVTLSSETLPVGLWKCLTGSVSLHASLWECLTGRS